MASTIFHLNNSEILFFYRVRNQTLTFCVGFFYENMLIQFKTRRRKKTCTDIFSGKVCLKSRDQKPHHKMYSNKWVCVCVVFLFYSAHIWLKFREHIQLDCITVRFFFCNYAWNQKYCSAHLEFEMMSNHAKKLVEIRFISNFFNTFRTKWSKKIHTHTFMIKTKAYFHRKLLPMHQHFVLI